MPSNRSRKSPGDALPAFLPAPAIHEPKDDQRVALDDVEHGMRRHGQDMLARPPLDAPVHPREWGAHQRLNVSLETTALHHGTLGDVPEIVERWSRPYEPHGSAVCQITPGSLAPNPRSAAPGVI